MTKPKTAATFPWWPRSVARLDAAPFFRPFSTPFLFPRLRSLCTIGCEQMKLSSRCSLASRGGRRREGCVVWYMLDAQFRPVLCQPKATPGDLPFDHVLYSEACSLWEHITHTHKYTFRSILTSFFLSLTHTRCLSFYRKTMHSIKPL